MKNRIYAAAVVLLALVLAGSGWNGVRAIHQFTMARTDAERSGTPKERDDAVRAKPGTPLAELSRAGRAIVFVFSPGCAPSRANMANWTEIVRETRGSGVALFAVGPVSPDSAAAFWGELARHVRVIGMPAQEIDAALGVRSTPATLLVENGRIRAEAAGPLRQAARRRLSAFASRGPGT